MISQKFCKRSAQKIGMFWSSLTIELHLLSEASYLKFSVNENVIFFSNIYFENNLINLERDHCTDGTNDCDPLAICHSFGDGFTCQCPPTCVDVSLNPETQPGRICVKSTFLSVFEAIWKFSNDYTVYSIYTPCGSLYTPCGVHILHQYKNTVVQYSSKCGVTIY